ncbi:hypothetical protein HOLleu_07188 [Holothuria leucospilota]|uniref:Uncharacterized protein n=1 Tax=Holothuria leucospilota TaxID=206669 RepID=A0A9Q1CFT5_HOLLE|nr:hypothetical protein HOLleu_07188 [Holothuria leucospilota]
MSNMKIIVVMLMVMPSFFYRVKAACCSEVESVDTECSGAENISIAGETVVINSMDARIKLPGGQKSIDWFCGSTKNTIISPSTEVNQIRVNYNSNGTVHMTLYYCDEIPGPFEAGTKCTSKEITSTCSPTADLGCIYELRTDVILLSQETDEKAAAIREAGEEVSLSRAGVESSVNGSRLFSTSEGLFLEVPPGASFCTVIDGISVEDVHTPSGFNWRCSLSHVVQKKFRLDGSPARCSHLYFCSDTSVCFGNADNTLDTCGGSSSIPVFSLLTWAAMVIVNAVASHF